MTHPEATLEAPTATHNAIRIDGSGWAPIVAPIDGDASSLQFLQDAVGGYIEVALDIPSPVGTARSLTVYCNEVGLLLDLTPFFAIVVRDGQRMRFQVYAGPCIIVATNHATGDTEALTADEIAWLEARLSIGLRPDEQWATTLHLEGAA